MREAVRSRVAEAIQGARRYLLAQAADEFGETRHTMRFPRAAGFSAECEEHSTDVFPRAVVANLLLDAVEAGGDDAFRADVRRVARREAEHVASRKLPRRAGGWSYFPDLPELPPDLDSLSAALLLFARAARDLAPACAGPVALALGQATSSGAIPTWLVSPHDDPADRAAMERGVRHYWGTGADVDVLAHFHFALAADGDERHRDVVRRGARFVVDSQRADGGWEATWYHGRAYVAGLGIRLLNTVGEGANAVAQAADQLLRTRRPEGGWGADGADPQETALALWALGLAGAWLPGSAQERSLAILLDRQTDTGAWDASPWIKMDVGRARGGGGPILSYSSATLATAFCLRTLSQAAASD